MSSLADYFANVRPNAGGRITVVVAIVSAEVSHLRFHWFVRRDEQNAKGRKHNGLINITISERVVQGVEIAGGWEDVCKRERREGTEG